MTMTEANAMPRYTKDGLIVEFDGRPWIVVNSDDDAHSCIDVMNAGVAHKIAMTERVAELETALVQAAVELQEAGNVLAGSGFPSLAGIIHAASRKAEQIAAPKVPG
jgi:hypothetical protein